MKVGVIFPQSEIGAQAQDVRRFVETVESERYDHMAIYDHVLGADVSSRPNWRGPYTSETPFHEVLVLYGYCAAITTRIELVTSIVILPQRQTALVAKQCAEIDILSGGRLRFGVGLGWNDVEYQALGEEFHNRGRRVEEQVEVLRRLWTEPVVTFHGRWHDIEAAGIQPLPVQRPIPLWMGAASEPAMRRAARMADGWFPQFGPDDQGAEMVRRFRGYVDEAGRDPETVGIEARVQYGDGDPERWKRELSTWRDRNVQYLSVVTMKAGLNTPAAHMDAIKRFKEVASRVSE
ncbi:MAG TPA: LLM class F420-dependent oxidoreductase [Chloroflexota bacterium]|jgi:probable F420-dependent oxidoreductase|nr:LLM class F420-dependent oxidoreductase [Chloroflexota bacterium]